MSSALFNTKVSKNPLTGITLASDTKKEAKHDLQAILIMILKSAPMVEYFHDKDMVKTIEKLAKSYKKKSPLWLQVGIIINNMMENLNFPKTSKNPFDFGALFE